jgi:hypothetical protein
MKKWFGFYVRFLALGRSDLFKLAEDIFFTIE